MNIYAILTIICTAYVVWHVWFTHNNLSTAKKIIWTISAFLFNVITLIAWLLLKPTKK